MSLRAAKKPADVLRQGERRPGAGILFFFFGACPVLVCRTPMVFLASDGVIHTSGFCPPPFQGSPGHIYQEIRCRIGLIPFKL